MHSEIIIRIGRRLQVESGLSGADFEVLVHLTDAEERRVRVTELANAMKWERSRLSHQLSRMEKRGLIDRRECPSDARGAFVVLTEQGLTAIEAAAPAHVEAVREIFFDALTPDQVGTLAGISDSVLGRLDQSDSGMKGSC